MCTYVVWSFRGRSVGASLPSSLLDPRRVDAAATRLAGESNGESRVMGCLRHHTKPPRLQKATWACFLAMKDHWVQQSAPGDNQPSEPPIKATHVPTAAYYLRLFSTNLAIHRPAQSSLWHLFANRNNYALLLFFRGCWQKTLLTIHSIFVLTDKREKEREREVPSYAYYFIFILFQLPHRYSESPDYIIFFISSPWFGMDAMKV